MSLYVPLIARKEAKVELRVDKTSLEVRKVSILFRLWATCKRSNQRRVQETTVLFKLRGKGRSGDKEKVFTANPRV